MTPEQATDAVDAARLALTEVAVINATARDRVQVAYRLGINKTEIHRLSGLARATIDRYLGHQP